MRRAGTKSRTEEEIRNAVLGALAYDSAVNISTIMARARLSQPKAESVLSQLIKEGLAEVTSNLEVRFKDERVTRWYSLTEAGRVAIAGSVLLIAQHY